MRHRLGSLADVPAGGARAYRLDDGRRVAVFSVDGTLHAIDDVCPHRGALLSGGTLAGNVVTCCYHGLRVDVASGAILNRAFFCLDGEAPARTGDRTKRKPRLADRAAVRSYRVTVADGELFLEDE